MKTNSVNDVNNKKIVYKVRLMTIYTIFLLFIGSKVFVSKGIIGYSLRFQIYSISNVYKFQYIR